MKAGTNLPIHRLTLLKLKNYEKPATGRYDAISAANTLQLNFKRISYSLQLENNHKMFPIYL